MSLEDLIDAVAAGMIDVPPPPPPPPEIEEVSEVAEAETRPPRQSKPGFFARLFGRR